MLDHRTFLTALSGAAAFLGVRRARGEPKRLSIKELNDRDTAELMTRFNAAKKVRLNTPPSRTVYWTDRGWMTRTGYIAELDDQIEFAADPPRDGDTVVVESSKPCVIPADVLYLHTLRVRSTSKVSFGPSMRLGSCGIDSAS